MSGRLKSTKGIEALCVVSNLIIIINKYYLFFVCFIGLIIKVSFVAVATCFSPLLFVIHRDMECDLLMIKIEKELIKMTLRHLSLFRHHFIPTSKLDTPFIHRTQRAFVCEKSGTDHIIWQAWVAKKAGQIVGVLPRK